MGGKFNSIFIRLLGPVPDGPANCSRSAGWRAARHAVRGAAAFVVMSLATVALDRDEGFRPSRERILVEGCALSGGYTVSERRALTASGAILFLSYKSSKFSNRNFFSLIFRVFIVDPFHFYETCGLRF